MHRIDTDGNDNGLFREGNPQIGQGGTILDAPFLNAVQEEICGVIEGAGIDLEKDDHGQLLAAIETRISAMMSEAMAAARGVGFVRQWPSVVAPAGYLECDGAVYLRADHADLFAVIGTTFNTGTETGLQFRVPDLRGEFVRSWDHGRGVDAGRALGSWQADEFKAHTHAIPARDNANSGDGAVEDAENIGSNRNTPTGSTGGSETRPRNVALMFVIRR
ncbi:phage tail protein [Brevundimonas sp.]|uniref:phage tail protein n=1 Tax=Brevundimonas sp. TaxID=1871086 RepID=UPI003F72330D